MSTASDQPAHQASDQPLMPWPSTQRQTPRQVIEFAASAPTIVGWREALATWLTALQSPNTQTAYASAVRRFFTTPGAPDLAALTLAHLDAYHGHQVYLATGRDCPPRERIALNTANLRLAGLRAFLLFCRRRGWLAETTLARDDIRDALKALTGRVERPYEVLDGEGERAALLAAAATLDYEPERAVALLALGLGAGLRVAELCALTLGAVGRDAMSAFVAVREGKGMRDRVVPIDASVYDLVAAYVEASGRAFGRSADRDTPLFLSYQQRRARKGGARAGQLTTQQARRIVARCVRIACEEAPSLRAKRITPHSLRHNYAIELLLGDAETGRAPATIAEVSTLLGHSDLKVTSRYVRHTQRQRLATFAPRIVVSPVPSDRATA